MKYWLSHLPLEVWVDVFRCRYSWTKRKELGEIVDQIGNRKFAEYLQFYLHDWGKRELNHLFIRQHGLYTCANSNAPIYYTGYPMAPMPDNIKFFWCIQIGRFDSEALAFIRRINSLFISNEVNLVLDGHYHGLREDLPNLGTILHHLAPLLNGIHSISFKQNTIPLVEQYFAPKLAQIKTFSLSIYPDYGNPSLQAQAALNFCLNWLTSEERDPAEPRFLHISGCYFCPEIPQQFSKTIQQQFLLAKRACTFEIHFEDNLSVYQHVDDFQLENNLGEQLRGQFDGAGNLRIFRHQLNAGIALEEWVVKANWKRYFFSEIYFAGNLTIGFVWPILDASWQAGSCWSRSLASHFDSRTIDFLHGISTLFTNVNLDLLSLGSEDDLPNLRTVLDHLSPLIHGINSLAFDHDAIPLVEQYFAPKLAQLKRLALRIEFWPHEQFDQATIQAAINFALNWLTSDGRNPTDEPKFLEISISSWEIFYQFSMAIKQQFLSAKRPCTFAFRCTFLVLYVNIVDFDFRLDLENNLGEQLHGKFIENCDFQIHRHQPNAGKALQEWMEETEKKCGKSSVLQLSYLLTIGQIDANADANEANDAEKEEGNEQPSISG